MRLLSVIARHFRRVRLLRRWAADTHGMATVEFAMVAGLMVTGMINAVDAANYFYRRMEVQNATQMGAQAAWKVCDTSSELPATTKCSGLTSAVTAGIQATSLGSAVNLKTGSPSEGYYCLNASNVLQYVSNVSSRPADCSAAGDAASEPVDYIKVETTYTYSPIFGKASVTNFLPIPITATAMMRLE